jgi:hypothetical protein
VLAFAVAYSARHIGLSTAFSLIGIVYLFAGASTLLSPDHVSFAEPAQEESQVV